MKNKDKLADVEDIKEIRIIPVKGGFKINCVPHMAYTGAIIVILLRAVASLTYNMDKELKKLGWKHEKS